MSPVPRPAPFRWTLRLSVALALAATLHAEHGYAQEDAVEASPGSPEAIELAKRHFDEAKVAYRDGAYRKAITELEQAIAYDPNGKDLFYNLGLVYEKLGELDNAIINFERFVEMETDPDEVERVRGIIKRLEGARDEIAAKQAGPASSPQPGPTPATRTVVVRDAGEPRKGRLDGWVYATGGVAVAALLVGTYYGVRAVSDQPGESDATGPNRSVFQLQDQAKSAHDKAVVADVAFGVSIAAGATAALLYFMRDAETTALRPSVSVGQQRVDVGAGLSF